MIREAELTGSGILVLSQCAGSNGWLRAGEMEGREGAAYWSVSYTLN